jgi:hypothetical protein
LNGELHREDGPAAEWADGSKFWYLNDKIFKELEFEVQVWKIIEDQQYLEYQSFFAGEIK